jgi:hypothetical protein
MRKFIILGVFVLITISLFGQSKRNIVIVDEAHVYFSERSTNNTPINFCIDPTNNSLEALPDLNSYIIFGYVKSLNSLVVGEHNPYNLRNRYNVSEIFNL